MKSSSSDAFRVGLVTWDFDPPRGGLGRALREIVCALREQSVHVDVYACSQKSLFSRLLFSLSLLWKFSRWIDCHSIDILLLPTGPGGVFLFRKPKRCRTIVICYHTYWQQCRMVPGEWWKRLFVPMECRTLKMADRVLCYCEDTRRVLVEKYGLKHVKLLAQILDSKNFSPLSSPKKRGMMCLYIGRKDRRKGFHILMKAWEYVQTQIPYADLRCVTRGDVPDQELRTLMHAADLVIVPSYLEGFGLVAAQAMAMGRAVLASDVDGLKSLIRHNDTGWLVPPGDREALSSAWVMLLRDRVLRERLGSSAKKFVRIQFNRRIAMTELMLECASA